MPSRMSCHHYPCVAPSLANRCGCVQEGIVLDVGQHIRRHILHHSCRKLLDPSSPRRGDGLTRLRNPSHWSVKSAFSTFKS